MQLSNFITRIIFTTAFISIIVAFIISIFFLYENFENDKLHIRKEFTEINKEQIKKEVITVYRLIEQKEEQTKTSIKERLKERAEYAHNLAMIIYEQNKDKKTEDEIKLLITTALNNLYPEDDKTHFSINVNNESQEGFIETNFEEPKVSFVKKFKPYNWNINIEEYLDSIKTIAQNEILEWISTIRFGENNYLFVNTTDGQALVFNGKKYQTPIPHPFKDIFKQQFEAAKNPDGGFFSYKFKKLNSEEEFDKLSYVKEYKKYNWIIGCGVYLDELNDELTRKEEIFKKTVYEELFLISLMFILIIIGLYITSRKISEFINININHLILSFEEASRNNKKIDTQNLTYKEFVSLANNLNTTLESKNQTEKKLQDYIQLINENIIISSTDKNGLITDVSEAFCRISGYSRSELIGNTHNLVRHPDVDDEFYEKIWEKLLDGEIWEGEIKNINKDGKDYWVYAIIKPFFKDYQIMGFTAIRTNITDKKHIEHLSITDELTDLYNRRFFNIKIEEEINRAKREDNYFSFLIMDIDYFKQYNDTYGHQAGDLALEKVAYVLRKRTSRGSDFAFRLGGEEFGIITTLNKEKVIEFANLIKDDIENLQIEHKASAISKYLTTSIGIVSKKGDEISNSDILYKEADDCLYQAKGLGRNSIFIL
jgi:diguanylate cyclase (GGDEF)-like protein/PAS domain S-box-containing protein